MFSVLSNRTYRHLFFAHVVALLGTGLATIALGLLAWQLAGDDAGRVLGTALAIKMLAYVFLSPLAQAISHQIPRRTWLIALDLIRASIALALPFVTEIWQIYVLVFLLQAASAGFTPTFQATIPDILPDEVSYTKALSLSRLAYEMENLLSPLLAAVLLTVVSFPVLFGGTVAGFLLSALLVFTTRLPVSKPTIQRAFGDRLTRGLRIYLATPRLRGLMAVNLNVAAAGAMVFVNTVVLVQGTFGLGQQSVAVALGAFGAGSMSAALILPRLLHHLTDRTAMLSGAALMTTCTLIGPAATSMSGLLPLWFLLGVGFSLAQTPAGRLLQRSAHPEDRPALYTAQFALSHAAWLITYPLAGWLGAGAGLDVTFLALAALSAIGLILATQFWPRAEERDPEHDHPDLPPDHPHLREHGSGPHSHDIVIDDYHRTWPKP